MRAWLLLAAWLAAAAAAAQPNGVLLVARPGLPDPNFRETVVLVTRGADATVGVILNRPTPVKLSELAPRLSGAKNFTEPLYAGGPVMPQVVVAVFAADKPPAQSAFPVIGKIYLSMHPANIEALVSQARPRMRLYAGFSGWAPRQLEREIDMGTWFVMRPREDVLFRKDTSNLWAELVQQVSGARAALDDILVP